MSATRTHDVPSERATATRSARCCSLSPSLDGAPQEVIGNRYLVLRRWPGGLAPVRERLVIVERRFDESRHRLHLKYFARAGMA